MRLNRVNTSNNDSRIGRDGVAAVEFALCLPLLVLILGGMWQVGRFVEVQQIIKNAARESARNASVADMTLQTIASSTLAYLQAAEPTAFNSSHSTSFVAPVVSLPANTTGYTCWDNTANQELFTITFTDLTTPATTDPTGMNQLDLYTIGIQVPFANVRLTPMTVLAGMSRLNATVTWASLVDTPYQVSAAIPAE